MYWVDTKYANLLGQQLEMFSVQKTEPYLANFRCPICGDSKKKKTKTRGYIYTRENSMFFKCHNCAAGLSFGNFLRHCNSALHDQYMLERYKEGFGNRPEHATPANVEMQFIRPSRKFPPNDCVSLDNIRDDHPARKYVESRQIPSTALSNIYWWEYDDSDVGGENWQNRIILPYHNKHGRVVMIQGRAYDDDPRRYISKKYGADDEKAYNYNRINQHVPVLVFEGPFDSMFCSNAIAVGNSNLSAIKHIPKSQLILCWDNEPRSPEICKLIARAIRNQYRVFIWPDTIKSKDLNAAWISGELQDINSIDSMIYDHSDQGAEAMLRFNKWRKCDESL